MNLVLISIYQFSRYSAGIDSVCVQLIERFIADGHSVINCCSYSSEGINILKETNSFETYLFPSPSVNSNENCEYLANLIKSKDINIVLDETYIVDYHDLCVRAKSLTPFKLISHFHGDPRSPMKSLRDNYELVNFNDSLIFRKLLKKIFIIFKYPISYFLRLRDLRNKFSKYYEESDAYVFLSQHYVKIVSSLIKKKLNQNKLYYISNPIKINKTCIEKDNIPTIIYVGRIVFQKRVDRLLDVWALVEKKCQNVQLVIIGDGEAKESLIHYSRKLKLRNVDFLGAKPSPSYIAKSIALCMVSSHEGLPMTILEAKSRKTIPIVYGSFESVYDIVKNNYDGIIVPPFSKRKFAEAIIAICSDNTYREYLSSNASKSVLDNSIDVISKKWYELFNILLQS